MVEYKTKSLNVVFYALADATRRKILQRLSKQSCNVTQLAEPFDISLNAVSKHLKILEEANLVKRIKKGRYYYFVFNHKPLEVASVLMMQLQRYWEERMDTLEEYLKSLSKEEK